MLAKYFSIIQNYLLPVFSLKKVHFYHQLPLLDVFRTNSRNSIGRSPSMVIPLLANQDLTPMLFRVCIIIIAHDWIPWIAIINAGALQGYCLSSFLLNPRFTAFFSTLGGTGSFDKSVFNVTILSFSKRFIGYMLPILIAIKKIIINFFFTGFPPCYQGTDIYSYCQGGKMCEICPEESCSRLYLVSTRAFCRAWSEL